MFNLICFVMGDLPKNVLAAYFDDSVNQESRVCDSYVREVVHDEKGEEHIKFVPFDSAKYQDSLGTIDLWSLEALLSAGIDPRFGISTGFATRLEGEALLQSQVDIINNEVNNAKTE